jgi:ABC-2 type transport system ATP-binding protein
MKQKLGLSCALIHQPRILLLDEPTLGVDPISRRDLWLIVHEMVAEGVTVVVSTSYLDEAERFDRVAFLHEGRIVALDTPAALRGAAGGVIFAVAAADLRGARDRLRRIAEVRRATVFGDRLHVVAGSADDGDRIARALTDEGMDGVEVRRIEPTLEDVFIDHVTAKAG